MSIIGERQRTPRRAAARDRNAFSNHAACATHLDAIRPQTAGTLVAARERVAEIRRLEPPEGYPKPWAREPDPEAPTDAAADEGGEPAAVDAATDDAPATG